MRSELNNIELIEDLLENRISRHDFSSRFDGAPQELEAYSALIIGLKTVHFQEVISVYHFKRKIRLKWLRRLIWILIISMMFVLTYFAISGKDSDNKSRNKNDLYAQENGNGPERETEKSNGTFEDNDSNNSGIVLNRREIENIEDTTSAMGAQDIKSDPAANPDSLLQNGESNKLDPSKQPGRSRIASFSKFLGTRTKRKFELNEDYDEVHLTMEIRSAKGNTLWVKLKSPDGNTETLLAFNNSFPKMTRKEVFEIKPQKGKWEVLILGDATGKIKIEIIGINH